MESSIFPILEHIPEGDTVVLCSISTSLRGTCLSYLGRRLKSRLNNPNLAINSVDDYIKLSSLGDPNFIVRGSERYIGLDEAVFRAVRDGDQALVDYFMLKYPEVGCRSRGVELAYAAAVIFNQRQILQDLDVICETRISQDTANLLSELEKSLPPRLEPPNRAFSYAMKQGYLPIIKWIFERFPNEIVASSSAVTMPGRYEPSVEFENGVISAIEYENLDVLEYLFSRGIELTGNMYEAAIKTGNPEIIATVVAQDPTYLGKALRYSRRLGDDALTNVLIRKLKNMIRTNGR